MKKKLSIAMIVCTSFNIFSMDPRHQPEPVEFSLEDSFYSDLVERVIRYIKDKNLDMGGELARDTYYLLWSNVIPAVIEQHESDELKKYFDEERLFEIRWKLVDRIINEYYQRQNNKISPTIEPKMPQQPKNVIPKSSDYDDMIKKLKPILNQFWTDNYFERKDVKFNSFHDMVNLVKNYCNQYPAEASLDWSLFENTTPLQQIKFSHAFIEARDAIVPLVVDTIDPLSLQRAVKIARTLRTLKKNNKSDMKFSKDDMEFSEDEMEFSNDHGELDREIVLFRDPTQFLKGVKSEDQEFKKRWNNPNYEPREELKSDALQAITTIRLILNGIRKNEQAIFDGIRKIEPKITKAVFRQRFNTVRDALQRSLDYYSDLSKSFSAI